MKVAAITMVHNESAFLPIWLRYYASQLGYDNLYLVDHRSNDNSITNARAMGAVNISSFPREEFDDGERAVFISTFHEQLLRKYDAVLFADVDEIIIPDPVTGLTLKQYIEKNVDTYINVIGLNVIHNAYSEPRLDFDKPLFEQRSFVKLDPSYNKPLISRVPMRWAAGFHYAQYPRKQARDLFMFHLRAMDVDVARVRNHEIRSVKLSKNMEVRRWGFHFRWTEEEYLDNFIRSIPKSEFDAALDEFEISQHPLVLINEYNYFSLIRYQSKMYRVPKRFANTLQLQTAKNA